MITSKPINNEEIVLNPGAALDNNNAHEMVQAIQSAQDAGFRRIIVDMSELEFLSSAGVGSILGNVEVARENGGDIVLNHVSDKIKHILEVLDLCEYLTIASETTPAAKSETVKG